MKSSRLTLLGTVLFAIILTSCAPPKTQSIWKAEDYSQQPQKVMVIAVSHQELRRNMVENVFVRKLSSKKLLAVPSHKYFPKLDKSLTREMILAKAKEIGADSLLIARSVSSEDLSNVQPDRPSYGWVYTSGDNFTFFGVGFVPAVKEYNSEMYRVASHVYSVPMDKMVWTSVSEVWVKESPESMVDPYTSLVLQQLKESDLIK